MTTAIIYNPRAAREVNEIPTAVAESFLFPEQVRGAVAVIPALSPAGVNWAFLPIYQFVCTHSAPDNLQSNATALRHELPTQPFLRSKRGQLQVHINQIITGSSGTEATGTFTSWFPRVLPD